MREPRRFRPGRPPPAPAHRRPPLPAGRGSPAQLARSLRDARVPNAQRRALAAWIGHAHGNHSLSRAVLARSPLSDELAAVWASGDKGEFYDRLRAATFADPDVLAFVEDSLDGDDLWLARALYHYGAEARWPIHLRVEREMKGWADCRGTQGAYEILRAAGGASRDDGELAATIERVFRNLDVRWIAQQLQAHGPESAWPPELQAELEERRRAAVVSELAWMAGEEATWTASAGRVVRGVTGDEATTFAQWAEAESETAAPKLGPATTINCWEMILLAAYNAGSLGWEPIHKVYLQHPKSPNPNAWFAVLARRFTPKGTQPYALGAPGARPAAGDIVLFDGVIGHVALATGGVDGAGRSQVLSFLPPLDEGTAVTEEGTVGTTRLVTIEWLVGEGDYANVEFGPPPW